MSSIVIAGDTSGSVTVQVPAVAGSNTVTIAAQTGTLNPAGPAFSVYPNSNTALSAGVSALLALGAKNFDTNGCFNNTGSTTTLNGLSVPAYAFCPNVPGYYQVTFAFAGNSASAQTTQGALYKNGSAYASGGWLTNSGTGGGTCLGTTLVYLNGTGDYLQFYVNSSITMGTTASSYYTYFTGFLARGA